MKIKIILVLFLLGLFLPIFVRAATYYVSTTGNDDNPGTQSRPWRTIAKVNASSFSPSDSILFKRGETWRGRLTVFSSGSSGNPITFGAYGTGAKPIINPSFVVSSWTGPVGGAYQASCADVVEEVFEDTIALPKATSSACSDGNWYFASNILYYKPTTGVPGGHVVGYIAMNYANLAAINISDKTNLTIDGLNLVNFYYGIAGIDSAASNANIIITNCDFNYGFIGIWFYVGSLGTCDAAHITNNYFYRCGNAIRGYVTIGRAQKITNWNISNNEISQTATIDGTIVWPVADVGETIGVQNFQNGTITGNYIHDGLGGGVIIYALAAGVCSGNSITKNRFVSLPAEALRYTGDGAYAINNNTFAYNIVWKCGKTYSDDRCYPIYVENGLAASAANLIANNVIYGGYRLVRLGGSNFGAVSYYTFKNNILAGGTDATFYLNQWMTLSNFVIDYNCYDLDRLYWGNDGKYQNLAWIIANTTYGDHDTVADPKFVNAAAGDFHPASNSSCINAGTNVGLTQDYEGNIVPQGTAPDIGAFEYVGVVTPPVDTTPPSIPTNLTATAVSSSQINLSWTASTDNIGVTGYRIYRGETQIATATTNSYQNTGLSPSTTYVYAIAAYDAANNVSNQSSSASATTQTTPPICDDECFSSGTKTCFGNGYKTCGNYDSDSCLEWSSITNCPSGQTCGNGQCKAQPTATLLKISVDVRVYKIINNKKLWIPTAEALNKMGLKWEDIRIVSEQELNQYPRLKLVRATGNPKVYYLTESGLERWIPTEAIFNAYNNSWQDVVEISNAEISAIADVVLIKLQDGIKIYKLENNQKRWIKTASAFNRLKYDWNKIAPVNQAELNYYPEGAVIQ